MALRIKDGLGNQKYVVASNTGSEADPFLPINGDIDLEIARGNVPGISRVNKFGANKNITSDTIEDVWDGGGDYTFPTAADITSLSQTTDQVAMRGASIEVQGLDASWALTVQTINLNATLTTTAVTLTTPLIRVFRMKVLANVVIDSTIRCHNAGETIDYAIMDVGNNQTLMAIYTVPAGKTAYMTSYFCDSVEATGKEPKSINFTLWFADRANVYEFQLKHAKGIPKAGSGFQHRFCPYLEITEKTDILIRANPSAEDANVHAGFDLKIVDN